MTISTTRYSVRLSCKHFVTFRGTYPAVGTEAYCARCQRACMVAFHYFLPGSAARSTDRLWCLQEASDHGTRLRCTQSAGHFGIHLDEPLGIKFRDGLPRLRSSAAGYGGRRP